MVSYAPYTHSLHDALPISTEPVALITNTICVSDWRAGRRREAFPHGRAHQLSRVCFSPDREEVNSDVLRQVQGQPRRVERSEEHTSELQSRLHLVCRLLLE